MKNPAQLQSNIGEKLFRQSYSSKQILEGVQIIPLKTVVSEEGDFSELLRLTEDGALKLFPNFQLQQVNRTRLFPGSVKAWHIHVRQDEIWYISPFDHLFVGLWDLRENSPTKNETMRICIGGGVSQLLYIPRGIGHGSANFSEKNVELFYFVNRQFLLDDPDEFRIHWDAVGKDFWSPERD